MYEVLQNLEHGLITKTLKPILISLGHLARTYRGEAVDPEYVAPCTPGTHFLTCIFTVSF
jgi:hypothetical protein